MRWVGQQPDWPDFRHNESALKDRELEFRLNSERLAGSFDALPMASQEDATIDLMLSEAIKTSAIEGEDLDRESVRSSLLSLITSDTLPDNSDQKAAGAASLLVDVRKNWHTSLTHEVLGKWQSMAVPEQRLKRVFGIDIETCPACGGAVKVIACIEDPVVIKRILDHLKQKADANEPRPLPESRAPPTSQFA